MFLLNRRFNSTLLSKLSKITVITFITILSCSTTLSYADNYGSKDTKPGQSYADQNSKKSLTGKGQVDQRRGKIVGKDSTNLDGSLGYAPAAPKKPAEFTSSSNNSEDTASATSSNKSPNSNIIKIISMVILSLFAIILSAFKLDFSALFSGSSQGEQSDSTTSTSSTGTYSSYSYSFSGATYGGNYKSQSDKGSSTHKEEYDGGYTHSEYTNPPKEYSHGDRKSDSGQYSHCVGKSGSEEAPAVASVPTTTKKPTHKPPTTTSTTTTSSPTTEKPKSTTTTSSPTTEKPKQTTQTPSTGTPKGQDQEGYSGSYDANPVAWQNEMLRLLNKKRAEKGLGPLKLSSELEAYAKEKADKAAKEKPQGSSVHEVLPVKYAENAAPGYPPDASPYEIFKAFVLDEEASGGGHYKNAMNPSATETSTVGTDGWFFQEFK